MMPDLNYREEISAESRGQAQGIEHVNTAVSEMDKVVQKNGRQQNIARQNLQKPSMPAQRSWKNSERPDQVIPLDEDEFKDF